MSKPSYIAELLSNQPQLSLTLSSALHAKMWAKPIIWAALIIALCSISLGLGLTSNRSNDPQIANAWNPITKLKRFAFRHTGSVNVTVPPTTDLTLVNQYGQKVRFFNDLVKNKVVIIGFVFTTCTSSCPETGANFARIQTLLGSDLGTRVNLISISIDPQVDSPQRLKRWGEKFGAKPGWSLLTGSKNDIDSLCVMLTGAVARKGMHTPVVLIGNASAGKWLRSYSLTDPNELVKEAYQLADFTTRDVFDVSPPTKPLSSGGGDDNSALTLDPAVVGQWSPVRAWPIVGMHMSVLPDGRVLAWHGNVAAGAALDVRIWDPVSDTFTGPINATTNLFCSGHSFLPDGRLLVASGTQPQGGADKAIRDTNIFDPKSATWSRVDNMHFDRWYPSTLALASGETLVLGGSYGDAHDGNHISRVPEVWQFPGRGWRILTNASTDWYVYYPWIHVAPDGRVFNSGPTPRARFLTTSGAGLVQQGPPTNFGELRDYGSSLMYDTGKVLILGGGSIVNSDGNSYATNTAETIDLKARTPQWTMVHPLHFPRKQLNAVILPTGKVLVIGGTRVGADPSIVYEHDIWGRFQMIGGAGNLAKAIAVAPFSDGRLDVYMAGVFCNEAGCDRSRFGGIYHNVQRADDSWTGWQQIVPSNNPGVRARSIAVSRNPRTGLVDLVMNGVEDKSGSLDCGSECGNVHLLQQTGANTWIYKQIIGDSGNLAKTVAVAPFSDGRLDVYMAGIYCDSGGCDRFRYGGLYHDWQRTDGSWTGWQQIVPSNNPGVRARSIAVSRNPRTGLVDLVMNGVEDKSGSLDCRSECGNVHLLQQTGANTWIYKQIIGDSGNLAKTVAVAPFSDGRLDVYMAGIYCDGRDCDPLRFGSIYHNEQLINGGWSGWQAVGNGGARGRSIGVSRNPQSGSVNLVMNGVEDIVGDLNCRNDCGNIWHTNWISPGPVYEAEMWDPANPQNEWQILARMTVPRTYHSTAVLLPDGRVLVAGGGQGGGPGIPDHRNAEIYSPPYLFQGRRPTIDSAPNDVRYGETFSLRTGDVSNISKVTLVRLPSTTHAYDENERFSPLKFTMGAGNLSVSVPANANLCPPGHYMIFIVDRNNVPSQAKIIHIGS